MSIKASFFRFLGLFSILMFIFLSLFIVPVNAGDKFKLPDERTYSEWKSEEGSAHGQLRETTYKANFELGTITDYVGKAPLCMENKIEQQAHNLAFIRKNNKPWLALYIVVVLQTSGACTLSETKFYFYQYVRKKNWFTRREHWHELHKCEECTNKDLNSSQEFIEKKYHLDTSYF